MGKKLGYAAAIVMAAFVALCLIVDPTGTRDAGKPGTEVPRTVAEDVLDVPEPSPMDGVSDMPSGVSAEEGGGEEGGGDAAMPEEPPQEMVLAPQEEPVRDLILTPEEEPMRGEAQESAQPSQEPVQEPVQEPPQPPQEPVQREPVAETYVVNTESGIFHRQPGCYQSTRIAADHRLEVTKTYQEMVDDDWTPCGNCWR